MPLSQDYDIPGCELDKDLLEWLSLRGKTLKDLYLSTKRLDLQAITQAWLPDGYSRILRSYFVWPFELLDYGSATLRCKI